MLKPTNNHKAFCPCCVNLKVIKDFRFRSEVFFSLGERDIVLYISGEYILKRNELMRPTVSLCMIVKNEERYLRKCLDSVKGFVDEIIIVDTGSTDRTLEIANEFNAKVSAFEWIHDFSAARNFAIQQASCDYILQLDADEYLEDGATLQEDIASDKDYYSVTIKNHKSDGGSFAHQAVRLFKNRAELHYIGKLHEHLNILDPSLTLSSGDASSLINHLGYLDDTVQEKNKVERNYEIMLKELEANPSPYSLYNMGKVCMSQRKYEEALNYFKKSYELADNMSYVYYLFCYMLNCLRFLHRYEEGISLAKVLIDRQPLYLDFHYELARLYEEYGCLQDAEIVLQHCLSDQPWSEKKVANEGANGYLSFYRLACIYDKQGRSGEAFEAVFEAIQSNPVYQPAIKLYLRLMLKANISHEEVITHLEKTYSSKDAKTIKMLLVAIYEARHPIMAHYFTEKDGQPLDKEIKAVVDQYDHKYEQSRDLWLEVPDIKPDNIVDLLTLSLILKDTDLMNKCRPLANTSHRDWKLIKSFIKREPLTSDLKDSWIEPHLVTIAEQLIVLGEFDIFEYISACIMRCSLATQIKLAMLLADYGFKDMAVDFLLEHYNANPNHPDVLQGLSAILYRTGHYEEAASLSEQLVKHRNDFPSYQQLYLCYIHLGNGGSAQRVAQEMKKKYSYSSWVQSL
ncbi:glycosyltransferase [Paenibacillus sp. OAS669]|uniref:glycosyltransferase n=1 Tax=Paenibacillus sp. OAS669 TaxID=2663821 RepID=UPI00178A0149|nr:glycosyltransferase [Paenibacillus sp. OAS669]MBE1447428.1 glycosyltransferase involved in cell wall biosynthesis [Paenibacillus sp. OAS669]